jgi:hypothetical protein
MGIGIINVGRLKPPVISVLHKYNCDLPSHRGMNESKKRIHNKNYINDTHLINMSST